MSPEDADVGSARVWCAFEGSATWYAKGAPIKIEGYTYRYLHRLIVRAKPGEDVDHINHNGLDNRRENLRVCTRSENLRNMKRRNRALPFKGVTRRRDTGKYQAQIKVSGRCLNLGSFDSPEEAALAYDRQAKKLFGEFALTNGLD